MFSKAFGFPIDIPSKALQKTSEHKITLLKKKKSKLKQLRVMIMSYTVGIPFCTTLIFQFRFPSR